MVLRSTRLRRSRIVCVRAPSQHTPKTPWKEEVVSFSLDDDARRRRREANARRRPDGTATNAYIARARVMRGKIAHREPTRWMRTTTESVELGRRLDSRARLRRVRLRRRRSRSSAGKRRAARTEDPRNMGTHTFLDCGPNGAMTTFSFAYDSERGRDSQHGGAKRRARGCGRDAAVGRKGDGTRTERFENVRKRRDVGPGSTRRRLRVSIL